MPHFLLTIDVEDWFQVENLRPWFPLESWPEQQLRIEQSTRTLLELLEHKKGIDGTPVQATFFVLGWIARRMPSLVREIHAAGHEVASHGDNHQLCPDQPEQELRRDLARSKALLEDLLGQKVDGYRAPSFSISMRTLELIREAGYSYDASYNSFALHGRYGRVNKNGKSKKGIALDLGQGFFELPLSNLNMFGSCLPCCGGGYFRLLPAPIFKSGVRRILKRDGAYHFYMHPWEVDHGQPRQSQIPALSRFKHYVNLHRTLPRLEDLLNSFSHCRFSTCRDYLHYAAGTQAAQAQ